MAIPLLSGLDQSRFDHTLVLAPSGQGKTSLLQAFLVRDLRRLINGECSILVIDSQKQLIPTITNLDIWRYQIDRLMVIDPSKYTPAFNPLYAGSRTLSDVQETFKVIVNSILVDSEFSGKQSMIFDNLLTLAMQVPNATLETVMDMTKDDMLTVFGKHIKKLHYLVARFFEKDYLKGTEYAGTRREIERRIYQMLLSPAMRGMFMQPDHRVNIGQAMNAGMCILIDTDMEHLKPTNSRLFGSFFIAELLGAILARSPKAKPCYVYIDEAHEYMSHSKEAINLLFKQARKRRIALTVATHNLKDFNDNYDTAITNTRTKIVSHLTVDARAMAHYMMVHERILQGNPVGSFIVSAPKVSHYDPILEEHLNYQNYEATLNLLDRLPTLRPEEIENLWKVMRYRYGTQEQKLPPPPVDPRTNQDW